MPRGVYDRSKSKRAAAAAETKTATRGKPGRPPKVVAHPATDYGVKFAILRENIQALSQVLGQLVATPPADDTGALATNVHDELLAEIETLSSLRREVFGETSEERQAKFNSEDTAAAVPQSSIPLPAAPSFVPPVPPQAS